jgi:hypothetical protein
MPVVDRKSFCCGYLRFINMHIHAINIYFLHTFLLFMRKKRLLAHMYKINCCRYYNSSNLKSVILTVDDDPQVLRSVECGLRGKYGNEL